MEKTTRGIWLRAMSLLALIIAPAVHAADSTAPTFALSRFEPTERGSRFFQVETLDWQSVGLPTFGFVADYAYKPLVIYESTPEGQREVLPVTRHFAVGHLGGVYGFGDRFRVGANLPVVLFAEGQTGQVGLVTYAPPQRSAMGDLRLSADWRFYGAANDGFRAGVGLRLFIPTGDPRAFASDGTLRGLVQLQAAGEVAKYFTYSARLGLHVKGREVTYAGGQVGSEVQLGLAAGARLVDGRLTVGPELAASTTLTNAFSAPSTSADLMLGAHFDVNSQWRLGLGVGRGLTVSLGSPTVRGLLSVEWTPAGDQECQAQRAQDLAHALERETIERAAREQEAVALAKQAAAAQAAQEAARRAAQELADSEEAARRRKLADDDGDGIANGEDACPAEAGIASAEPKKNGCQTGAVVGDQLVLLDSVRFATNSDVILSESDVVLGKVLEAIQKLPADYRYRVEGHTDAMGPAAFNKDLSERRAKAVVAWLLKKGLDGKRFEAAGIGAERPISPNDTEEHRKVNRRVEFHIVNRGVTP
jgi:outer membrane protein OmpA-like peptidoglycan-associated protein